MDWTKKQLETIETRDKNILVAAAAGSGKTAVLVERIRRMAMEEKIPIDSMLIVTFTRAAAAEMKEKIRRALKARLEEDPGVRDQLERLSRAQISTFHSFSLDVVRHFFFLTDLEPDISICDETRGLLMKEEALDDLFREAFDRGDEEFFTLLDWYGNEKNDGKVREIIKSLYNTMMALPDPFRTLGEKIEELENYEHSAGWAYRERLITGKLHRAAEASQRAMDCLTEAGLDRLAEKYSEERDLFRKLEELAKAGDLQGAAELASSFPRMILRARKEEADILAMVKPGYDARRKVATSLRDEVRKGYLEGADRHLEDISALVPVANTLKRILEEFHERFRAKKQERNQVDFNDIEHYCLEILKEPDARKYYRERFRYIFVDEYQDTSVMQESIIDAIAGKNNLFMVGDIKQSIYKFRLAEPEIFRDRYVRYGGDSEEDVRIDLNRNFRSKPVILDWINARFTPMMEGYDEAARLYPGIEDCPEEFQFRPEIRLLNTEGQADCPEEAIREMQKDELEAHLVCNIIEENLGRPFFDSKAPGGGTVRPMEFRDMAVLMRGVASTAPIYQDVMRQRGIPVFVDDSKGYYDTIEINVMMNLLSVIDNRYRDVPFLSVLRSEIFGFSTEELADIRLEAPEGSYVEAFESVSEGNQALSGKARTVLERLALWRELAHTMPLSDFVWMLMRESGYYLLAGAMPRGDLRQANLRHLVDLTVEFGKSRESSLYGFVKYIDSIKKDKNVDVGQVRLLSENDDVVRMMTIHKSKGLEFPLVIVAGISRKLTYTDAGQRVRLHKDVGLGMMLEDPALKLEKKTLPFRLVLEKLREEEREENQRILYVAMTRARDRLYLTGSRDDPVAFLDSKEAGVLGDSTFLDMMPSLDDVTIVELEDLMGEVAVQESLELTDRDDSEDFGALVRQRLSYRYPFTEAERIRSRYSVSALNAEAHRPSVSLEEREETEEPDRLAEFHDEPEELPVPLFLAPEHRLTGAERGTIYHRIMEYIDFPEVAEKGREALTEAMERMVAEEILLPVEVESVEPERILAFFQTSLGKRCVAAARRGELFREESFVLAMEREGEQTGVQGVIDVFFREEGHLVLLDYKTNRIDPELPQEKEDERIAAMYRKQQALYAQALEKASGKDVAEAWLYLFQADRPVLLAL